MLSDYLTLSRSIHVLCLGSFINRAGSFVMIFLTVYISEQLGFSKAFATQCMGAFGFGAILASLLGGQLADQLGRKVVMIGSLVLSAALLILLSAMQSAFAVLLTIAAYGLAAETFRPACSAMIGDLTEEKERPAAFSLYYIAINLGFACGPPIGGTLADYSFRLLFWFDAITLCVFALILTLFIPETKPDLDATSRPTDLAERRQDSVVDAARRIASDRPFVLFCIAVLLGGAVFCQSFSTLPVHIINSGYSNQQFGIYMAINGIMIFLCQLPLTKLLERFASMGNMIWGTILLAIGFGMYAVSPEPWLIIAAIVVWTSGEMMQEPFKHSVVTRMAPVELRARYHGVLGMCFSVALMIGAPLGGYILEHYGPSVLWSGCFALSILAAGVYAACGRVMNTARISPAVA